MGGALSLFDELLDFLATFLSDFFVEVRSVAIASGFAAFLAALLSDLLVKLVAVSLFRGETAFSADLLVKL
ncbi:MAG TPA: hypothetical protein VMF61_04875, partial [Candidatus Acidoferrales bacterium]|nr:hypothetical protein [Candidatus Acidoferrales bacterium]